MPFLIQSALLFLSSLVAFGLIYFKVPITSLQQVVLGSIIVLIILLDRFVFSSSKPLSLTLRYVLLFLISLAAQVLVLSSGGFYSPFLVLFHLLIIALSFLINIKTAVSFLAFSIITLGLATLLDQRLAAVSGDFGSIVLYLLSFIVIIPLAQVVAKRYHLKDTLSKILTHQLKVQRDVFEGLSDMVIITDTTLKILSFNEAATRVLRLSPSELVERSLFECLILKDLKDQVVDQTYLSIDEILQDKTTRIVKNLLIYIRNIAIPKRVNIQLRPTVNLEGKIDQLAFIISDAQSSGKSSEGHQSLQEALLKHEAALEDLKSKLISKGMIDLGRKAELFGKAENDILVALELQDHGLKPVIELKDICQILSKIISLESLFAKTLGVETQFKIDDKYTKEAVKLIPAGSNFSPAMVTSPFFTVPLDSKWFDLLIQKLLDIAILLVSGSKSAWIQVFLTYDKEFVYINITVHSDKVLSSDERFLFTEYYGRLGIITNLHLGSGLEGYMAKTVASLLGIGLDVKVNDKHDVEFILQLSKRPHKLDVKI